MAITEKLAPYPSTFEAAMQWVRPFLLFFPFVLLTKPHSQLENHLAETIVNWGPWQKIPGHLQAYFFGLIAMVTLPNVPDPKKPLKTYASEALHFRRGIRE